MFLFEYLESISWAYGALAIVGVFIALAIVCIFIIRLLVSRESLRAHHDFAGFVFANLGVLYAVLVGFIVVNVQQRFDQLKQNVQVEASYLTQLYRDAEVFPEKDRLKVRAALIAYTRSVIGEEWDLMGQGVRSPNTIKALKDIWASYYNVNPASRKEIAWYSESINKLNELMKARLFRLLGSEESLGEEMWILLIIGGVIMTVFTSFFGLENLPLHLFMASILAASIAFLLFLIYSLDTAFSGGISVSPEAVEKVLDSMVRD